MVLRLSEHSGTKMYKTTDMLFMQQVTTSNLQNLRALACNHEQKAGVRSVMCCVLSHCPIKYSNPEEGNIIPIFQLKKLTLRKIE